jgi:hypothetical protein
MILIVVQIEDNDSWGLEATNVVTAQINVATAEWCHGNQPVWPELVF